MVSIERKDREYLARPGQGLLCHLTNVAKMCETFCVVIGCRRTGHMLGMLHDIGKYTDEFQEYIRRAIDGKKVKRGEVRHAVYSGMILEKMMARGFSLRVGDVMANVTMSHHGELQNMIDDGERSLVWRTKCDATVADVEKAEECSSVLKTIDGSAMKLEIDAFMMRTRNLFMFHLLTKFFYSSLVDADRCDAAGIDGFQGVPHWHGFNRKIDERLKELRGQRKIDYVRGKISRLCFAAGARERGIYTLSVPTGGGKTLSSLRFAVEHARTHGMKRIVYVIPFLSIIDQTAKEFSDLLGEDASAWMLEHHSNFEVTEKEDSFEQYKELTARWDRPLIVTTMVQFLETVVSNKASSLRKFHNMSETVFIFDEIQSLPVTCVNLFNQVVNFLVEFTRSTAVLCTATQPILDRVSRPIKFGDNHSLVCLNEDELAVFKRTNIIDKTEHEMTVDEVAEFANAIVVSGLNTLIVVNTKKVANEIYLKLNQMCDAYVLTTNMCAQHRLDTLEEIRNRLKHHEGGKPFVCVSTQLIEAGVDVSFDCVIRSLTGWTSVIQSAGRCNRHGESATKGNVYLVKIAENLTALPEIADGKEISSRILREFGSADLATTDALAAYNAYYFHRQKDKMDYPLEKANTSVYNLLSGNSKDSAAYEDVHGGQKYRGLPTAFRTASDNFRVIDGTRINVLVPYKKEEEEKPAVYELIERLKGAHMIEDRKERYLKQVGILRELQRYMVSVYSEKESEIAAISEKIEDLFYLVGAKHYCETGFVTNSFLII